MQSPHCATGFSHSFTTNFSSTVGANTTQGNITQAPVVTQNPELQFEVDMSANPAPGTGTGAGVGASGAVGDGGGPGGQAP